MKKLTCAMHEKTQRKHRTTARHAWRAKKARNKDHHQTCANRNSYTWGTGSAKHDAYVGC